VGRRGSGYLALAVPAGEHVVRLELGRTPLRAQAEMLSLFALLLLLAAGLSRALRRRDVVQRVSSMMRGALHPVVDACLIILGVLVLAAGSSPPEDRLDDLTMDFVAMPYLHHNPEGVEFSDDVRLLSYTLSDDRLTPAMR